MAFWGWALVGAWGLLLLLSGAKGAEEEKPKDHDPLPWMDGELCRSWEGPEKLFWCPRRRDGMEAKFCCGTCSLPYCCSSEEDRLDPQQCPKEGTTAQPPQQLSGLWLVSLFIILTVATVLVCMVCFYCIRNRPFWATDVVTYINQRLTRLRDVYRRPTSSPPLILDCSYDVLPPRFSDSPPPPYLEEDSPRGTWEEPVPSPEESFCLEDPENPGGEAGIIGSLVHRNVPNQVLDSSLEAESSV